MSAIRSALLIAAFGSALGGANGALAQQRYTITSAPNSNS